MIDVIFFVVGVFLDKSLLLVVDECICKCNVVECCFCVYGLGVILILIVLLVILMFIILIGGIGLFCQIYVEILVIFDVVQLDKFGNCDFEEICKVLILIYGKLIEIVL